MEKFSKNNFIENHYEGLRNVLNESGINENEFKLFSSLIDLKHDYLEIIKKHSGGQIFQFIEEDKDINPFWQHTTGGILIEFNGFFGDFVDCIWTPWGKMDIIVGGVIPKNINDSKIEFINKYKLQSFSPYNDKEEVGVLYQLNEINGMKLPLAQVKPRENFAEYDEVKSQWEKMHIIRSFYK